MKAINDNRTGLSVSGMSKRRMVLLTVAALVIFVVTYLLVLPAFTLDEEEARDQGGITLSEEAVSDPSTKPSEPASESPTDKEAELPQDKPSTDLEFEGDGYQVSATCEAKAQLPEDTELSVQPILKSDDKETYNDYYDRALQAVREDAETSQPEGSQAKGENLVATLQYAHFYDISLMDGKTEVEPEDTINVSIAYEKALKVADRDHLKILHFAKDPNTGEETVEVLDPDDIDLTIKQDQLTQASFQADSFSVYGIVYTVDFHWNVDGDQYDYSIQGGSTASLKSVLQALKITDSDSAETFIDGIEKVEFSDPSLLYVQQISEDTTVGALIEDNKLDIEYSADLTKQSIKEYRETNLEAPDWALISLKPFETEETLTVTMKNGEEFVVAVTDARVENELDGQQFVIISLDKNLALTADNASLNAGTLSANNVTGNGNQIWKFEYSSNSGQYGSLYRLKSIAQDKYIDIDENGRITLTENASNAADFIIDKDNNTYQFQSFLPPNYQNSRYLNTPDIGGTTRYAMGTDANQRFALQAAQTSDKKGDWLLFVDEEQDDIYIHVGDTITLRPYDKWTWKPQGENIRNDHWVFDSHDNNKLTNWNISSNAGNESSQGNWTDSNGVFKFNRHIKYDTELDTRYWSVQGEALKEGTYVLGNTVNDHKITVHVLPAEDPSHQLGSFTGIDRIKVNLFDYDKEYKLDPSNNQNLNYDGTLKYEAINIDEHGNLRPLHFTSSGGGSGINDYTKDTSNPGIVAPTLVNGFPVLAEDQSSLQYLFDTSKTTWSGGKNNDAIIAYPNVTGMFQQDRNGYYYFNSNSNYAYYDPSNGNKQMKLYEHTYTQWRKASNGLFNSKPIGFFPFHDYDSQHDLSVNQNHNLNHHLGMSMEVTFALPAGKTAENGDHISFDFTGDDDMWVFVDDGLALDVGGVHQPIYRKIDFTDASQFVPGREYTLRVFYLERGGCDSNCAIRFNLPLTIGSADVRVVKEKAKDNSGAEEVFLPGAKFGLWENENCTGDPLRMEDSNENGVVLFDRVPIFEEGQVYYMKEMQAPTGYHINDTIYKVTAVKDTNGNFSFVVTEKDNESAQLDKTKEAPHSPIIYDEPMNPIALTVEKEWVGGVPENASATFEVKRYKSFDGIIDTRPCTLNIYRYKDNNTPQKVDTKYYKSGTTATVSWNYCYNYNNNDYSIYGHYNYDNSSTWQTAGREGNNYQLNIAMSQAGETRNLYLRDINIGTQWSPGVTNISISPNSNNPSTGTQTHLFEENAPDESYHGPTKTLSASTGWTWTFDEQPAYHVRDDGIVEYYSYYIEETEHAPSDYLVAYDSMTGDKITGSNESETRKITNYKNEVYVEKRWYGADGQLLDPQPTDQVSVTLSSTNSGQITGDATKSITAQSHGVWTVEDDAEKMYTASEEDNSAYETTYTFKDISESSERTEGGVHRGGTIYVNNKLKTGSLQITKTINKNGNLDTSAKGTFYYAIYKEEYNPEASTSQIPVRTGSITVSENGTATVTESGLYYGTYYVYELTAENGTPVVSQTEGIRKSVNGTVYKVTGSGTNTVVGETDPTVSIVNDYETVDVQVHKIWVDNNNAKGKRPAQLKVTLSNGDEVILSEENEWKASITGLPKYNERGKIDYTWTEETIGNGYAMISRDTEPGSNGVGIETTTIKNGPDEHYDPKTSFSGTKTWEDDGTIRPDEITVILYKTINGDKIEVERKTLAKPEGNTDEWTYEFSNVPVFDDNGNTIQYSVEEILPTGYTCAINSETSVNPNYERDEDHDTVTVHEPNAEMTISTGVNLGFIVMKHGNDFIIWTPRKASDDEINLIKQMVAGEGNKVGDQEFSQIMNKGHLNVYGVPNNEIKKGNMTAAIVMDGDAVKVNFGNKNWSQLAWGQLAYTYTPGRTDLINTQKKTNFNFSKKWLDMMGEEISWDKDIQVTVKRNKADGSPDENFGLQYSISKDAIDGATSGTKEFAAIGGTDSTPKLKLTVIAEGQTKKYSFELQNLPYASESDGKYTYYVQETNEKLDGYLNPSYSNISAPTGTDAAYDGGTIINKQEGGVELPHTGGPGTTIFYILGSILLIGCGIALTARRRIRQ